MKAFKCVLVLLVMLAMLFAATDAKAQYGGGFGFNQSLNFSGPSFGFGQPVFAQPFIAPQPVFAGPFLTQPAFISSPVVVQRFVRQQPIVINQPQSVRTFRGVFGAQRQVIRNF